MALRVQADYAIDGVRLGLRAGGSVLLRRQRYFVEGRPVLVHSYASLGIELLLDVPFG